MNSNNLATFAGPDQNYCRMKNFTDVYDTHEEYNPKLSALRYFFVSKGEKKIIYKAVDYTCVGGFNGAALFNPGFGDYDPITDEISDDSISDNGDQYKVFHTNRHLDELLEHYTFYGGEETMDQNVIEPFQKRKNYKVAFCSRKNL